ncbi:MAG: hypothetical protein JNK12_09950 [Acidimicrobiales bacterium]|nr:hypothetical protein [Acidimicrobiales bacterium]
MISATSASTTRKAVRAAATLLVAAALIVLGACGDGVEPRAEAPAAPTTTPGAGSLLLPPASGPVDVPEGEDPSGLLGEDPRLDELAQACFEGDLFACDTLFLRTEVDSELEAYSQTCGGRIERQAGAPGCAERFDVAAPDAEAPGVLGDDAELDALAQACFGGDAGACDDLYLRSPVDSAYEAYGATCGGRLALASDGGCQSQFGTG